MSQYLKINSCNFIEISAPYYQEFEQKKYKNKIKKILFFIISEGLIQTCRKIFSVRLEKEIIKEQKIIACQFNLNGTNCIGIGKQLYQYRYKKFHPKLIFKIRGGSKFDLKKLRLNQNTLLRLDSFFPANECLLDERLIHDIISQNPELESFNFDISKNYLWNPIKVIRKNSKLYFIYGFGSYVRSYSDKFFKNNINSIIDYNKKVVSRQKHISFFEDYRDSLQFYSKIEKPIALIATYHSSHFKIAKELFYANPNGKVFIEKPLVVKFSDALELINLRREGFWFEAGYNRRYIDWNERIKQILRSIDLPKIIDISVKELLIPPTHWYYWSNQGTRITGNLCHWIDLAYFWIKYKPCEMSLLKSDESVSLSILFEDGSLVNIMASDQGNNLRGVQEKIEIRASDKTIFIDDYKKMVCFDNGRTLTKRKLHRDKGHDKMYKRFLEAIENDKKPAYKNDDILWVSYMTEKASQMFTDGERYIRIDPRELNNYVKSIE